MDQIRGDLFRFSVKISLGFLQKEAGVEFFILLFEYQTPARVLLHLLLDGCGFVLHHELQVGVAECALYFLHKFVLRDGNDLTFQA